MEVTLNKMAYQYELPITNASTTGADAILTGVATAVPIFIPAFLTFMWLIVFILGYKLQKTQSGGGNAPMWATLASTMVMIMALTMSNISGLVNAGTLTVTVVITIASGVWLITSKE